MGAATFRRPPAEDVATVVCASVRECHPRDSAFRAPRATTQTRTIRAVAYWSGRTLSQRGDRIAREVWPEHRKDEDPSRNTRDDLDDAIHAHDTIIGAEEPSRESVRRTGRLGGRS